MDVWRGMVHTKFLFLNSHRNRSKIDGFISVTSDTRVDVYNLNGLKVASKIAVKDLNTELEDGVYIINGKKHFIE